MKKSYTLNLFFIVLSSVVLVSCRKEKEFPEGEHNLKNTSPKLAAGFDSASGYTVSTLAGTGMYLGYEYKDGVGANARFYRLKGIAALDDAIYAIDYNAIRKISLVDSTVTTVAGAYNDGGYSDGQGAAAEFLQPEDIAAYGDKLYITDAGNFKIRTVTKHGLAATFAGGDSGYVDGPISKAKFGRLKGITVDKKGNIYVSDNYKIRKISKDGIVSTLAGSVPGNKDGVGASAQLWNFENLAIDDNCNLFAPDYFHNQIKKISKDGTVSTFAGSIGGQAGSANGLGSNAKFSYPNGVAISPGGNLYIADTYNCLIRSIKPNTEVSTFAGVLFPGVWWGEEAPSYDGEGVNVGIAYPRRVIIYKNVLYISEGGFKIRTITPKF